MTRTPLLAIALMACHPEVDFPALGDTAVDPTPRDTWNDGDPADRWSWAETTAVDETLLPGPPIVGLVDFAVDSDAVYGLGARAVWRSDDDGLSWTRLGFPAELTYAQSLGAFAGELFVVSSGRLFTSSDEGDSWRLDTGDIPWSPRFVPSGDTLYAVDEAQGGAWVYRDDAWTALATPAQRVGDLLPYGDSPDDLLLTDAFGPTLYASADGGDSWTEVSAGGPTSLWPDGDDLFGSDLYSRILRHSTDGGVSWVELGTLPHLAEQVWREGDRLMSSAAGSGLFASSDGGATWTPAADGLPEADQSQLYDLARTASGSLLTTTYRSEVWRDDGTGFSRVSDGLVGGTATDLAWRDGELLATYGRSGLYRWQADKWLTSAAPTTALGHLTHLAVTDRGLVAIGSRQGVFTWFDDTPGFVHTGAGLPQYNGSAGLQSVPLGALTRRGDYLFAPAGRGSEGSGYGGGSQPVGGGVIRSADGGTTWTWAVDGLPVRHRTDTGRVAYDTGTAVGVWEDVVLLGTSGAGLYISDDRGQSWTATDALVGYNVRALARSGSTLLALTSANDDTVADVALHASTDAGRSWAPLSTDLPEDAVIQALAEADDTVFALVRTDAGRSLWRTDGAAWTHLHDVVYDDLLGDTLQILDDTAYLVAPDRGVLALTAVD